jgi:hypothetical protein
MQNVPAGDLLDAAFPGQRCEEICWGNSHYHPHSAVDRRLADWPYSAGWGYYPGGGLGLVLIIVVVLISMGRI